ncbi:MAG: ParB/RepB/Spo0J family partition protein [Firmicutes bacterium]|nr:ParB/RepB/Spo0J family partition protein [Bacillota bacterium]
MAVKRGLGKGLGALLSDSEEEYYSATEERIKSDLKEKHGASDISAPSAELLVDSIDPNVNQPRKNFDETAMNELVNSIRMHGVISPIIVVKNGARYMIIAGERRWRASKKAGLKTVPAIIRDYTPQQVKEISLIENLQREDLNPIETANAIRQLMDEYKYTQEEVADRIGKSRSAVANTLRLLTLTDKIVDLVASGRLSAGHARCLVVVDEPEAQLRLAMEGVDNKVSVRDFEKKIKAFLTPKQNQKPAPQSIELKDLVSRMQRVFATKVSALGNDTRGRIYVDYYTRDDLDRLAEMIAVLEKGGDT